MLIRLIILSMLFFGKIFAEDSGKIQADGGMETNYDKVYNTLPSGQLVLTDHFSNWFWFGAHGKPHGDLNWQTRLSYRKSWNSYLVQNRLNIFKRYLDEGFNLDFGFFEYNQNSWLSWGGGRLHTADEGIFPKLSFGSNVDGAFANFFLDEALPQGHHLKFTITYTPYLLMNYNYSDDSTTKKPRVNNNSSDAENLAPMASIMATYQIEKFKLVLHHLWLNYLAVPDSTIGEKEIDSTLNGTAQIKSDIKFFLKTYCIGAEIENLWETNLSLVGNLLVTEVKSQGTASIISSTSNQNIGRDVGGFGTSSGNASNFGTALLLAGRYDLNWPQSKPLRLGGEYLFADKYSYYFDSYSEDSSHFYETKGKAYHLYIQQLLKPGFYIRVGLRFQNKEYGPFGFGEIQQDSSNVQTRYVSARLEF